MQRNIYEYLCDRVSNIPHILSLCGADKKYICENASDFEKFRELCRTLVSFSGSSIYKDINCAVSELFGENIDISQSNAESLWKEFYGERGSGEAPTPILTISFFDIDLLNAVNISKASGFVKPDKYHASLAREKARSGQDVSEAEKNMLIVQELREGAEQCVKTSRPLVIRADCPVQITYQALGYLRDCKFLPNTFILTELSGIMADTVRLLEFENVTLGAAVSSVDESIKSSMRSLAQILPVGGVVWALDKDSFDAFCTAARELLDGWKSNNTAPQKCVLKFEKNSNFIKLNY